MASLAGGARRRAVVHPGAKQGVSLGEFEKYGFRQRAISVPFAGFSTDYPLTPAVGVWQRWMGAKVGPFPAHSGPRRADLKEQIYM